MRILLRAMTMLLMMAVLVGCVSTELSDLTNEHYTYMAPQKRAAQLRDIVAWRNSGAFSVKIGKKVNSANFIWEQSARYNYRISISSALNIAGVTLIGGYHSATLWTTETKFIRASTPEAVMQKELGWSLPVTNLFYWVRDLQAPGRFQDRQYDKYGHLRFLKQQGWKIRWTGYVTKDGIDYPRKIQLYRPGVYILIVIKHWLPLTEPMYGTTINAPGKS